MKPYRCWHCNKPAPPTQYRVTTITIRNPDDDELHYEHIAFCCTKECLAQWITDNWDKL